MKKMFFYLKADQPCGPHSMEELIKMCHNDEIASDTQVAGDGSAEWLPLSAYLSGMQFTPTGTSERHLRKWFVIVLALVGTLMWLFTFGIGMFVSSVPHLSALKIGFTWKEFVITYGTYTPTNIAILTCLAAFAGGAGSRLLHWNDRPTIVRETSEEDRYIFLRENPFSSMLRGFAVYLSFLAGVYVSTDSPFANPNPPQYVRIAGVMSLMAFVVGYDPTLFRGLLHKASKPSS